MQRAEFFERAYGGTTFDKIALCANVLGDVISPDCLLERKGDLAKAEFVFTGWGAPDITALLPLCPQVKVIFFAGGTASFMLDPDIWKRGILFTSSYVANAVPVAEYTLAAILFGLKGAWRAMADFKLAHRYFRRVEVAGAYRTTVGLISCGAIARELLRLLRSFDLRPLVYDPFINDEEIRSLGGEPAGLEEIFAVSEVVSLHSPELNETRGMITGKHLASMMYGATFINTARGSIVVERELCEVARQRPDLQFVLDVVNPEPPREDSLLFDIPNIVVTPHLAGAMGGECKRMGQYMLEEFERYLASEPLRWVITPSLAARSIHRPEFMEEADVLSLA